MDEQHYQDALEETCRLAGRLADRLDRTRPEDRKIILDDLQAKWCRGCGNAAPCECERDE